MVDTGNQTTIHCRRVDGLPGTPCKTCGRTVVQLGSGSALRRLSHAKPAPRYSVAKLPGKGEGWAVFDATTQSSVVGTRSTTRREAFEALAEMDGTR